MTDTVEVEQLQAVVTFTFTHACEHPDYSRTVVMPAEYASDFTTAVTCGADGMTMLIRSRIESVGGTP
jgi:hypothetical protein